MRFTIAGLIVAGILLVAAIFIGHIPPADQQPPVRFHHPTLAD